MFGLSLAELLVIGVVTLVLFGPEKLPEIGRILARTVREFRKISDTVRREVYRELYPPPPAPSTRTDVSLIPPPPPPTE